MSHNIEKRKNLYENAIERYLLDFMLIELTDLVKNQLEIKEKKIVVKSKYDFINLGSSRCRDVMSFDVNYILVDRNICITVFLGQDFYEEIREVIPIVKKSLESVLRGQNIFFGRIFWSLGNI